MQNCRKRKAELAIAKHRQAKLLNQIKVRQKRNADTATSYGEATLNTFSGRS